MIRKITSLLSRILNIPTLVKVIKNSPKYPATKIIKAWFSNRYTIYKCTGTWGVTHFVALTETWVNDTLKLKGEVELHGCLINHDCPKFYIKHWCEELIKQITVDNPTVSYLIVDVDTLPTTKNLRMFVTHMLGLERLSTYDNDTKVFYVRRIRAKTIKNY